MTSHSWSHDAVIRVYDEADNMTAPKTGLETRLMRHASPTEGGALQTVLAALVGDNFFNVTGQCFRLATIHDSANRNCPLQAQIKT